MINPIAIVLLSIQESTPPLVKSGGGEFGKTQNAGTVNARAATTTSRPGGKPHKFGMAATIVGD